MGAMKIVLLCVLAAVAYGIVHDQVTVRISLEYFTVVHPQVFDTEDPTLLALGWGVIATWWVGLLLGLLLAAAARVGSRPKRSWRSLVRPVLLLLLVMGVLAALGGLAGHFAASRGWLVLTGDLAERIDPARHAQALTAYAVHNTSYAAGAVGALVLAWRVHHARRGPPTAG